MKLKAVILFLLLSFSTVYAQGLGSNGGLIALSGPAPRGATGTNILTGIASMSATYTITLADVGGLIQMNTASTTASLVQSVLIPSSATVQFPIGAQISVVRWGVGEVRIAGVSPVVVYSIASPTSTPYLLMQYSPATIVYLGTDTFFVGGHIKDQGF